MKIKITAKPKPVEAGEFNYSNINSSYSLNTLHFLKGGKLINDYFNIDRKFMMHLRDYKEYIDKNQTLIVRTAPKTRFGVSNVYNELPVPLHSGKLALKGAKEIQLNTIKPAP